MTISGERTEQLDIFCRVTWLYKWFSQFRSRGTYSVLSWSPSVVSGNRQQCSQLQIKMLFLLWPMCHLSTEFCAKSVEPFFHSPGN